MYWPVADWPTGKPGDFPVGPSFMEFLDPRPYMRIYFIDNQLTQSADRVSIQRTIDWRRSYVAKGQVQKSVLLRRFWEPFRGRVAVVFSQLSASLSNCNPPSQLVSGHVLTQRSEGVDGCPPSPILWTNHRHYSIYGSIGSLEVW